MTGLHLSPILSTTYYERSSQINYTYFAQDGNYGDATNLILVETDTFTADDFEDIDLRSDHYRAMEAELLASERDRHYGNAIAISDDDCAQACDTLEAVISFLTRSGAVGWAEQLGDIRDLITRKASI